MQIPRAANIAFILALALNSFQISTLAEKTEGASGLAYGEDHAYFITAPPGWILDTESGARQGVFAVFYPKGSSWDGPAVMYSNAAAREGRSPEAAAEHDVELMRKQDPRIKVADGGTLTTKDKKTALVRYFTGGQFSNYEAAAYVVENKIVANIILTARNKAEYDKALPAFRMLVGSYRFISDQPDKLDLNALGRAEGLRHDQEIAPAKQHTNRQENDRKRDEHWRVA